ncbi:ankyrin [Pandoraea sputorum]|uniref:Ankyrin n=2 Tax=Pandoraea sputorum TaxID=93222 RepID=A0A5E5B4S3_9BURK|nr:ankyrin [Pandoraea sputorum]
MPGTPPITTLAHSTSTHSTTDNLATSWPHIERQHLSDTSLADLLDVRRGSLYRTQDIWNMLVDPQSRAGRELRDACEAASPNSSLYLELTTLLTMPESERTIDRLTDAGVFLIPARAGYLRPEDAALLRSNEGLLIWLQYAASPTAYLKVFDSSDIFGATSMNDRARIAKILRILVACGRDRTAATPSNPSDLAPINPLSHLCSQVAPHWLRRILELGGCPQQMSQHGVPLTVSAMRAEAIRLHNAGQDVMCAHRSLQHLAELLKRYGANLMQPNAHGVPAVALLAFQGLCGAAEALLISGASPNAADPRGNTLMHHLAYAIHLRALPTHTDNATLAHFALIVAIRHRGNLDLPNAAGHTARAWLPAPTYLGPHVDEAFLTTVRTTAFRRIGALS